MFHILPSPPAFAAWVDTWNPYPAKEFVKPDFAAPHLDRDRALSLSQPLMVVKPTAV